MLVIFYVLLFIGQLAKGVPLEDASDNYERYFTPHIVGGVDAPKAYAPHMAALVVGDDFKILSCGGSIVHPKVIMSAAHCIDIFIVWGKLLPTFHAVVGSNNWNATENTVHFEGFHVHPGWNMSNMTNDVGFLVLEKTLVMTDKVAMLGLNFNWVGGREISYVTGWGRLSNMGNVPYKLQILYLTTISSQECIDDVHAASVQLNKWVPPVKPDTEICTFHSPGHGMCNGDSGSALVSTKTNTQIGLVSWGFPCAIGAPDVFVRISAFECYINEILNQYATEKQYPLN